MWLVWIGIALVAAAAEVASLDFVLLMISAAALAAAGAAILEAPLPVQVLVFAGAAVVSLLAVRPPLVRWLRRTTPRALTNVDALVGQPVQVLAPVSGESGLVRLAGEEWSARTESGLLLPVGSRAAVVRIDGACAVVTPLDDAAHP